MLVWLSLLMSFVGVSGKAQFEGVVESKNLTTDETGARHEFVMTMWIKKDMVKVTTGAIGTSPSATMVYRNDKGVVWILNEESKTYSEISKELASRESPTPKRKIDADNFSVKRTGKSKRILGFSAEQILIRGDDQRTEIWGTRKLRNVHTTMSQAFGGQNTEGGAKWTDKILKMGLFPLVSSTVIGGKVVESQEITRIESRKMPRELFEIPVGYRRQSTDEMIRGLQDTIKE